MIGGDFSEQTIMALANAARRKARERLRSAGAESTEAMQRRVRAFAQERGLPAAEIAKLMYKRVSTSHFMAFCKKHNVSAEWLLCGDLRSHPRSAPTSQASNEDWKHMIETFGKLDRRDREGLVSYLKTQIDV
jgi:hypothetical protein